MNDVKMLHELCRDIRNAASEIKIANDYETACAIWESAFKKITDLYRKRLLSDASYKIYCDMLDRAMVD